MQITTKKLSRGQAEIIIELSIDEYQPFLNQAATHISEHHKIPGFRPGKASLDIVKQHIGEAEVWEEALELAVRKTFLQAIEKENLNTVGAPEIEIIKLAPGNPVTYKATVSLLPKIDLTDYSKIKVKEKKIKISAEQIEKMIADLQKMRAKEILVDRQAKKGDKVEINFETFLDKIPVDQGKQEKFPLVIGENTFIPGFEDQLIGLGKDEEKKFQLKFPDNYHQKNLAGKMVDFKVKMNLIYELQLPELNDEFAKIVGNFKNVDELKHQVEHNLEHEEEHKEAARLEEEILEKIIAESKFDDIPDLLVNSEAKKMLDELEYNLRSQGLGFDDYLTHLRKKREDLLLDFTPQAVKRVKSALIMREIAKKENIIASEKDIEEEVQNTVQEYGDDKEVIAQVKQPEYRDYLRNLLTSRKVIDHLKTIMVEK